MVPVILIAPSCSCVNAVDNERSFSAGEKYSLEFQLAIEPSPELCPDTNIYCDEQHLFLLVAVGALLNAVLLHTISPPEWLLSDQNEG
jgi:hypothetical protein